MINIMQIRKRWLRFSRIMICLTQVTSHAGDNMVSPYVVAMLSGEPLCSGAVSETHASVLS